MVLHAFVIARPQFSTPTVMHHSSQVVALFTAIELNQDTTTVIFIMKVLEQV